MGRRGRCGELGQEESPRCPSLPRLPAAPHPGAERASVPARPGQARPPPLAPRCPDPPCSERGWLLASPRSSGERGRGLLPFRPSREQGPRFFLESPWAGPFVGSGAQACVFSGVGGVPRATALVPGMLARGQRGAGTSGGDLPPLVILWATPPPPGSLFSRVLELGTLHIQESTRFKNERGASFTMPSCRECWEGF